MGERQSDCSMTFWRKGHRAYRQLNRGFESSRPSKQSAAYKRLAYSLRTIATGWRSPLGIALSEPLTRLLRTL